MTQSAPVSSWLGGGPPPPVVGQVRTHDMDKGTRTEAAPAAPIPTQAHQENPMPRGVYERKPRNPDQPKKQRKARQARNANPDDLVKRLIAERNAAQARVDALNTAIEALQAL